MSETLPASVRRQAEEAAQLQEAFNAPAAPNPPDPPDPPAATAPAPTPQAPPPAPTQPQPDVWEQKYRTLQGILEADQRRSREELQNARGEIDALRRQMQELAAAKAEPKQDKPQSKVTDQEVEAYGSDLIDLVRRIAQDVLAQSGAVTTDQLEAVRAAITAVEQKIGGVEQKQILTAEQQFWGDFNKLQPDAEQVNADPRWLNWLAETDDLTGAPRQASLNAAFQAFDAERASRIISRWKQSVDWAGAATPNALPPAVDPSAATRAELEAQVAPGASRSSVDPVGESPDTKVWALSEVTEAYDNITKGKYTQAEATRIQQQLDLAVAQGRIRQG